MVIDVKLMMLMVARCHFQRICLFRAATTERGDSRGSLMGPEAPLEAAQRTQMAFTFLPDVGHVKIPCLRAPCSPLWPVHRDRKSSRPARTASTSSYLRSAPLALSTLMLRASRYAPASDRNGPELAILVAAHDHTTPQILRSQCQCTCPPPKALPDPSASLENLPALASQPATDKSAGNGIEPRSTSST